jgi:hypothetical protein
MIVEILRSGKADAVVQKIAADMLKPPKRNRGRQKTQPQFWYEIGQDFHERRDIGVKYEDAIRLTSDRFCFSESHVRNAIEYYDRALAEADEASRN